MNSNLINNLSRNRNFKYGVPFLVLVIGGSFALKQFTSLRYEYSTKSTISADELEKEGIVMKKPGEVTLETEYDKIKTIDTENWESVRIPRPWDETPQKIL